MAQSLYLLLLFLVPLVVPAAGIYKKSPEDNPATNCVYTVYIRTGSIFKAGTDSKISLQLLDVYGNNLTIDDLEAWGGMMPEGWNYFERGNLDIFSGLGYCLDESPCKVVLSSDGSGGHHGWYVNYVEVSITGPHLGCAQNLFTIEQWLATDVSPYELVAARDKCPNELAGKDLLKLSSSST